MLLRTCCRCHKWLGIKFGGWFHPWLAKSHGFCQKCYEKEMEALNG